MPPITLASTALMGVLLLALVIGLRSVRQWESPVPSAVGGGEVVDRAVRTPVTWILGFLVLVVAFGGGAVLAVSDGRTLPAAGNATGLIGLGLIGLLGLYLTAGVYASLLHRGHGRATAVAFALFVLGLLAVLGITVNLVIGA